MRRTESCHTHPLENVQIARERKGDPRQGKFKILQAADSSGYSEALDGQMTKVGRTGRPDEFEA
jgi:hypothetical protein